MLPPGQICSSGSASDVTLDGNKAIAGGEPVSVNEPHQMGITFDQCLTDEATFSGKALADFNYTLSGDGNTVTLNSRTQLLPLTDVQKGVQGKGVFAISMVGQMSGSSTTTFTPAQGAVLMRANTTRTMTFVSGRIVSTFDAQTENVSTEFQQLRYVLNGHTYVLDGATTFNLKTPAQASGSVAITRDGVLVGNWKPTGPAVLPAGMGVIDLF